MTADTVLIVTASYDEGADYVIKVLHQKGTPTFRLNTDEFPLKVQINFQPPNNLTFSVNKELVLGESIKSVWYRRFVPPELPEHLESNIWTDVLIFYSQSTSSTGIMLSGSG